MQEHVLKTDPMVFNDVWMDEKNFEIRKNDRDFKRGDLLILKETTESKAFMDKFGISLNYTGRLIIAEVTYILQGPIYGLMDEWCIMCIKPLHKLEPKL